MNLITITPEPSLEKALQENLVQDSDYDIPVQEEFPDATMRLRTRMLIHQMHIVKIKNKQICYHPQTKKHKLLQINKGSFKCCNA